MRYKSLKIAIIAGIVVKIGQEIELNEKVANHILKLVLLKKSRRYTR